MVLQTHPYEAGTFYHLIDWLIGVFDAFVSLLVANWNVNFFSIYRENQMASFFLAIERWSVCFVLVIKLNNNMSASGQREELFHF